MSDVDEKPEAASSARAGEHEDAGARAEPSAGTGDASAAPATAPAKNLAPRVVFGAFALAGLGALGIHLALSPDGDPVGDVDLLDADSTVVIDGTAGDSVTFVSRVTTGLGAYRGSSWKSRSNDATTAMKDSTLDVVVVGPDGAEQTSSCALWGGSRGSDRPDDEHLTENGVINDCEVALRAAGKHTVRASVKWDPTLDVTKAQLTVYRDAAQ